MKKYLFLLLLFCIASNASAVQRGLDVGGSGISINLGAYGEVTPEAPTLSSWTVQPDGISSILVFSEAMEFDTGGSGGFTTDTPTYPYTYSSGTTTDTVTFSHSLIYSTATDNPLGDFTQPTDGWQSVANSLDLASFTGATIDNQSTQTPTTYALTLGVVSDGTITIDSTGYTSVGSPHTITGLLGATAMTAAYGGSNDTLTWSGTDSGDVTGTYPNYSVTMDAAKSLTGTFSIASAFLFDWDAESVVADVGAGTTTGVITGNGTFVSGGVVGNAYDNVDDNSHIAFTVADITGFDITDFTLTMYFNGQTLKNFGYVVSIGVDASNVYQAHWYADGTFYCRSKVDGTAYAGYIASAGEELSSVTWYKLVIDVDEATDTLTMTVDDDPTLQYSIAMTSTFSGTPTNLILSGSTIQTGYSDSLIDEVTIE